MAMPEGFFENRFPVLSFPNIDCLTANDKDFSLRSKGRYESISSHSRLLIPNP